jgi:hypothetical protein
MSDRPTSSGPPERTYTGVADSAELMIVVSSDDGVELRPILAYQPIIVTFVGRTEMPRRHRTSGESKLPAEESWKMLARSAQGALPRLVAFDCAGNPSSAHGGGGDARVILTGARDAVAELCEGLVSEDVTLYLRLHGGEQYHRRHRPGDERDTDHVRDRAPFHAPACRSVRRIGGRCSNPPGQPTRSGRSPHALGRPCGDTRTGGRFDPGG